MPEIAPWENPNLPPPFATVEREIEGRTRHFALWRWDERLVWQDLKSPRLWWATLDVATSLSDWEDAIENWRFGRAFTEICGKVKGKHIAFSPACTFSLSRTFYIIASDNGTGIAREKADIVWLNFTPLNDAYTKSKLKRAPSIWHINRFFFGVTREVTRAFAPVFLKRFPLGFQRLIIQGKDADSVKILRDLIALNVYRKILFAEWIKTHHNLYERIIFQLDLPIKSYLSVVGERKQINGVGLKFGIADEYQRWDVETSVSLATNYHELLELQLRLRDALCPILTPTEIEEILNPPTRL